MRNQVETINARIYVGLREGYTDKRHSIGELENVLQKYANKGTICVTLTPTKYVYKDGNEDGAIIGIINYPRFPKTRGEIEKAAEEIAQICKKKFKQKRVSIEYQNKTVMFQ